MNVSPLISAVMPVPQMPIAASPEHILSFDQLMPTTRLANSIIASLPEQTPSSVQPMPKAVVADSTRPASPTQIQSFEPVMPAAAVTPSVVVAESAVSLAMSDFPEKATAATMPERNLKPAPDAKLQSNARQLPPRVIVLPFRTITEAKTLSANIEESAKTPYDAVDERPVCPEALSFIHRITAAPVAILPLPSDPFVELKPALTITQLDPEAATVMDLPLKSISTEKPVTLPVPFQAALDIAHPPAITPPIAPTEPATTGHIDLAHDMLWLDQLAREIVAVASSDGRLKFRLSPETLGNLDVAISTRADGVNIQLHPSTEAAARILTAEQPKLTEELRQSGIKLVNNDLLGGQHMGNARDQSQMQHPARQVSLRQSAQPTFPATLNPAPTQPQRGRFA